MQRVDEQFVDQGMRCGLFSGSRLEDDSVPILLALCNYFTDDRLGDEC